MPNWCSCDIKITGPQSRIKNLLAQFQYEPGQDVLKNFLSTIRPEPPVDNTTSDANAELPDWYARRLSLWGTKWDADLEYIQVTTRRISGGMETAWSPPIRLFAFLAEMDPKLNIELKFYEGGMGFQGVFRWKDGELVHEEERNYRGSRGG